MEFTGNIRTCLGTCQRADSFLGTGCMYCTCNPGKLNEVPGKPGAEFWAPLASLRHDFRVHGTQVCSGTNCLWGHPLFFFFWKLYSASENKQVHCGQSPAFSSSSRAPLCRRTGRSPDGFSSGALDWIGPRWQPGSEERRSSSERGG